MSEFDPFAIERTLWAVEFRRGEGLPLWRNTFAVDGRELYALRDAAGEALADLFRAAGVAGPIVGDRLEMTLERVKP
jgi:hypothetical protein